VKPVMVQPMRSALLLLAAVAALNGCATPASRPAATFANPVLDTDFPDPAVIRAEDGTYWVYATQSAGEGGAMRNIQMARSTDLVRWELVGDALPEKPAWASKTQDFWAPHVHRADRRYYLYYSARPDAALTDQSRGLCLAVATADRPEGPFRDTGRPLQCGDGFVNIDPFTYDDPATGKRLFYWGSGFGPIKVQELAPDRISFAPGSKPIDLIHPIPTENPSDYRRLIEGAWIVKRDGWYYLFYSGDNCCGPKAHYAVMVARSRSATGPFESPEAPAHIILEQKGRWGVTGHNSVVRDASGTDWMLYHAVDARRPRSRPTDEINTRRIMLIDRIVWENGWPRVAGPTDGPQPAPRVR
jgi:arabinan endo-1,5-alpha-L-arabinosidase